MSQKCKIVLKIISNYLLFSVFAALSSSNKCACFVGNVAEIAIPLQIVVVRVRLPYSLVGA
jgi:hypothetical protein